MKVLLYINGYAYSSTIVYLKEGVEWRIYYICRDYLGSITRLANADGSLSQELSYDAWGRLRNPQTWESFPKASVYELRPKVDGYYRKVGGGQVYMTKKDVWKIGETTQGVDRYNVNSYERKNFDMMPIYYGNKMEILIQEKRMIYGYFFRNGTLPPENRIFR